MRRPYGHVVKWSRTAHIYVTMYAFILMLFFAFTGFFLNHEDWFTRDEAPIEKKATVPRELLAQPDKLGIVELLRSQHGARGAVTTFDVDERQIHIELAGPGRNTSADIDRLSGEANIAVDARGWVVRLDDMHRGKNSGRAWSWMIDVSAVSLFLGSLTGILMWIGLPRRRKLGVIALVVSLAMCGGLYYVFVP